MHEGPPPPRQRRNPLVPNAVARGGGAFRAGEAKEGRQGRGWKEKKRKGRRGRIET